MRVVVNDADAPVNGRGNCPREDYNVETRQLLSESLPVWARDLSSAEHNVEPYLVWLKLTEAARDSADSDFLNTIPTSFSLTGDQVDRLIAAGRQLLRDNPEFHRLQVDIAG